MAKTDEEKVEVPVGDSPEVADQRGGAVGPEVAVDQTVNPVDDRNLLEKLVESHPLRAAARAYHEATVKQDKEAAQKEIDAKEDFDAKYPVADAVASVQPADPANAVPNNAQL